MRPGAIYWCERYEKPRPNSGNETDEQNPAKSFLDINYFTLDFNTGGMEPLEEGETDKTSSACFIRCVEDIE